MDKTSVIVKWIKRIIAFSFVWEMVNILLFKGTLGKVGQVCLLLFAACELL